MVTEIPRILSSPGKYSTRNPSSLWLLRSQPPREGPRVGLRCAGWHRSCPRVQPFYLLDLLASGRSLGSSYKARLNPQPLAFRLGNSLHWGSQGPLGRPAPERKQLVTLKIRPTKQRSTSLVAAQHAKIKSTTCTTQNSAPPQFWI